MHEIHVKLLTWGHDQNGQQSKSHFLYLKKWECSFQGRVPVCECVRRKYDLVNVWTNDENEIFLFDFLKRRPKNEWEH